MGLRCRGARDVVLQDCPSIGSVEIAEEPPVPPASPQAP
jgi:hypothetical protein